MERKKKSIGIWIAEIIVNAALVGAIYLVAKAMGKTLPIFVPIALFLLLMGIAALLQPVRERFKSDYEKAKSDHDTLL